MHWHADTCEAFFVETHDNGADSKNCVRCFFLNPLEQQQKNRKICTSILFSLTCTTSARAIHTNPVISFSLACCLKVKAIAFLLHLRSVFFTSCLCATAYLILRFREEISLKTFQIIFFCSCRYRHRHRRFFSLVSA